jgi:hypothetical protein
MRMGVSKVVRSLALAAVGVTLASGCGTESTDATPPTRADLVAKSPEWMGSGIVHAQFKGPNGRLSSEEWLNRRNGAVRIVTHETTGRVKFQDVTVQDGLVLTSWSTIDPQQVYRQEFVDENDPALDVTSQLLRPWRMLRAGRAEVVSQRTLNAREVLSVRLSASAGGEGSADLMADVDPVTLLPLRFRVAVDGQTIDMPVELTEIPESTSTDALFEVPPTPSFSETRLAYDELGRSVDFTVWALGPTYRSLAYGTGRVVQENGGSSGRLQPEPEVFVGYVQGDRYSEPIIEFTEQAAATEDGRQRLAAFERGVRHKVIVAGSERTVFLLDEDRQPVYFALVVGETLIKGVANVPATQLLRVLGDLRSM